MIAAQTVNCANVHCSGNGSCECDELENNYGDCKCQFTQRETLREIN
jgi:hypothetical protein